MSISKKRSSNFSLREKEILISLVKKYFHILENKKTNAVFNRQKNEYWERVAKDYNALQITGLRTAAQLKSTYEQMKKLAKQHKAEDKVESLQTGGGVYISKVTALDDKILDLIKDNYFFIENKYDCNTDVLIDTEGSAVSQIKPKTGGMRPSTNNELKILSDVSKEENIILVYEDCDNPKKNLSLIWEDTEENRSSDNLMPHCDNLLQNNNKDRHVDLDNINNKSVTSEEINHYMDNNTMPLMLSTPKINQKVKEKKGQKRKMQILKSKHDENKKMQLIDKKISLLDTMQKVEEENLKGKILDNEIKEIIKEKELIVLSAKKLEHNISLL